MDVTNDTINISTSSYAQDLLLLFKKRRKYYEISVPILLAYACLAFSLNAAILSVLPVIRNRLNPTLMLVVSLGLADLWTSVTLAVSLTYNSYLYYVHDISTSACVATILEALKLGGFFSSILHLLALAFHHYLMIVHPLSCKMWMTELNIKITIMLAWFSPSTIILIGFGSVPNQGFRTPDGTCRDLSFANSFEFRAVIFGLICLFFIVITALYCAIVKSVKRMGSVKIQRKLRESLASADSVFVNNFAKNFEPLFHNIFYQSESIVNADYHDCAKKRCKTFVDHVNDRDSSTVMASHDGNLRKITEHQNSEGLNKCFVITKKDAEIVTRAREPSQLISPDIVHRARSSVITYSDSQITPSCKLVVTQYQNSSRKRDSVKTNHDNLRAVIKRHQSAELNNSNSRLCDNVKKLKEIVTHSRGPNLKTHTDSISADVAHKKTSRERSSVSTYCDSQETAVRKLVVTQCQAIVTNCSRQRKTVVTTLLMCGTFFIGWLPSSLMYFLMCSKCPFNFTNKNLFVTVYLFGFFGNVFILTKTLVNPIVYAVRIPEIQQVLLKWKSKIYSPSKKLCKPSDKLSNGNNNQPISAPSPKNGSNSARSHKYGSKSDTSGVQRVNAVVVNPKYL